MEQVLNYKSLKVEYEPDIFHITFNRIPQKNSINQNMLEELNLVFDSLEKDNSGKVILLKGKEGYFCTGMDFAEMQQLYKKNELRHDSTFLHLYIQTLKRMTLFPCFIISLPEGKVMAGGAGIIAASDWVIAIAQTQISLTEAIWGLVPAMVAPYMIRRIGFSKAYSMAITTLPLSATHALTAGLVDEVSGNPEHAVRRIVNRVLRIENGTFSKIKNYFHKMWNITEEMEKTSITELVTLLNDTRINERITGFINHGKYPWEYSGQEKQHE